MATIRIQRSDEAVLHGLGERLARARLDRNLTQAQLAREAGVSKRTIVRLEAGQSTQVTNLIRVLRVLDLVNEFEAIGAEPETSPIEQLATDRSSKRRRQRASGQRRQTDTPPNGSDWTWDPEPPRKGGGDS